MPHYFYLYNIKLGTIVDTPPNNVMDQLYFEESRVPTNDDIANFQKQKNADPTIRTFLLQSTALSIQKIKKSISKIEGNMPLYDIYAQNIFIVNKHNVYDRVIYKSFRFPKSSLIKKLDQKRQKLEEITTSDPLILRKLHKLHILLEFMKFFHIPTLYNTYIQVFYKYSPQVGQEITVCSKPSFSIHLPHIKPYFTKNEVIATAKNMGLFPSPTSAHTIDLATLCTTVQSNEMTYHMLQLHQKHIIDNDKIGLVQFYTLQGGWYINQYLRNLTDYGTKNVYLEKIIEPMWQLVRDAPPFDKPYILYRFIKNDAYLRDTGIGDIYTEPGFMSTTRNPFYRSDLYQFGFILIKVKIPAHTIGVGLALETISHFPEEQEIIFPPQSKFKLVGRDKNCVFFHTDPQFTSKVKTRYEFEWLSGTVPTFSRPPSHPPLPPISFLTLTKPKTLSLGEKIRNFADHNVDSMQQFQINLSDKLLTISTEWHDSTSAYKNFYALTTNLGFSLYTFYQGYILFFIEIGENNDKQNEMHINFHLKYSALDVNKIIGDDALINFFASVAHYFDVNMVFLYASYLNCDSGSPTPFVPTTVKQRGFDFLQNMRWRGEEGVEGQGPGIGTGNKGNNTEPETLSEIGGSYCLDIYQYLKHGIKKYSDTHVLNMELQPKFSYYDLDSLKNIDLQKVLSKDDRDELYQVYDKYYRPKHENLDVVTFYLWLKENKCYLIKFLIKKLNRVFPEGNPFKNPYYVFDASTYLYNRKQISVYPTYFAIGKAASVLGRNEYRR